MLIRWNRIVTSCLIITAAVFLTPSTTSAQLADTIRVGSAALAGALPHIGTDTIDAYRLVNGEQIPSNTQIRSIARYQEKGDDILLVTIRHVSAGSTDTTVSQSILQTDDLSLVRQRVRSSSDSGLVTYAMGMITGWVVPPQEDWRPVTAHLGHRVFADDGLAPWMCGLLPLKDGYEAAVPYFTMWSGEENIQTVRVTGSESLTDGDREVDCWTVEIEGQGPPGYTQLRWISKQSRRMIKQAYFKGNDDPEFWSRVRIWF